jgi:Ca2+:H+ antiporter
MKSSIQGIKTRHKEYTLLFPITALVILIVWGATTSLPLTIAINLLALAAILVSAFNVVRHADVLAH